MRRAPWPSSTGPLPLRWDLACDLWVAGLILWVLGHSIAVFAAKRDPAFVEVLLRHLRQRSYLKC